MNSLQIPECFSEYENLKNKISPNVKVRSAKNFVVVYSINSAIKQKPVFSLVVDSIYAEK